jgi:hypothetical protein
MDCEKVRDQFSSLWEKDLMPSEEKIVREHLSSCPECQKEFERFAKTMGWLHSAEEVEVPEGFLHELYKKMDERKNVPRVEKSRRKWSIFPTSFKLPAQAVAMVAIVFLVLYLTKMMPMEVSRQRDVEQTSSPLSEEKKSEQVFAQKKTEHERRALKIPPETARPKDIEYLQAPTLGKKKMEDTRLAQAKEEAKKEEAPAPKSEMMASQQIESKEAVRAGIPTPGPDKLEKGLAAKEKSVITSKPPQEITLRIMDREKAVSQIHELVKQFGGEMVTTEGNKFIASLPTDSLPEFEKELAGLSVPTQADKGITKKQIAGSLRAAPGMKREEVDEKSRVPVNVTAGQENRTIIFIHLIQK